jgi:putative intracellular protease/amidase
VAAPRLLPPTSELAKLVEAGLTHQQIADRIRATTGVVVARSTVSVALSKAGLARDGMRYRDELPWRVKGEHLTQYPARMLRLLGRRRADGQLTEDEADRLDAWLEGLAEKGLVVAYAPDADGFLYVEADETHDGKNGVPIRRRIIELDELT